MSTNIASAGRQASKSDGTYSTLNSWRYADLLYKVETNDPNIPDVTYDYGGNGIRRQRTTTDGAYTWYNYAGFSLQSEEDALGALDRTYVGRLADLTGANPATATARYFTHDMLGSTRGMWDGSKAFLGAWEPTPYGAPYTDTLPSDILQRFTGHILDPVTEAYYAPFRYYDPGTARWMKVDPIGMINGTNMYTYVRGNPVNWFDPLGLWFDGLPLYEDLKDLPWMYDTACQNTQAAQDMSPLDWYNNVKSFGPWDYKNSPRTPLKPPTAENFGNFNYGATAAAQGMGLDLTLAGSAGVHAKNHGAKNWKEEFRDHGFIKDGYNWGNNRFPPHQPDPYEEFLWLP